MNWTLDEYLDQRQVPIGRSFPVVATRKEARQLARKAKLPQICITQTIKPVGFAIDDWGQEYTVAPDGSYDVSR